MQITKCQIKKKKIKINNWWLFSLLWCAVCSLLLERVVDSVWYKMEIVTKKEHQAR